MDETKTIQAVAEFLAPDLLPPHFPFLEPDEKSVRVLALQPWWETQEDNGVRAVNQEEAGQIVLDFARLAIEQGVDLAIAPELSVPWTAIETATHRGVFPPPGRLWAFGCESCSEVFLNEFAKKLPADIAFIRTPLADPKPDQFLDPLCFLFVSKNSQGQDRRVLLVQFKTKAMGDRHEADYLATGKYFCKFSNTSGESNSLIFLICSDSLRFDKGGDSLRAEIVALQNVLIVHIQLNNSPRHHDYTRYRQTILRTNDNAEVLTLNWSSGSVVRTSPEYEVKDSVSCWYMKALDEVDLSETTINANHDKGLYLTYCPVVRMFGHVADFEAGAFRVDSTKVSQRSVAPLYKRVGPRLRERFKWNPETRKWMHSTISDRLRDWKNDFSLPDQFVALAGTDAVRAERIILLSCGAHLHEGWPNVTSMHSFKLGDREVINRLTFLQDTEGKAERDRLLAQFRDFNAYRMNSKNFPTGMGPVWSEASLDFQPTSLYENLWRDSKSAAAVYLGANSLAAAGKAFSFLESRVSDPDLLCVWYTEVGILKTFIRADRNSFTRSPQHREKDIAGGGL
jgi:hypothetical protein